MLLVARPARDTMGIKEIGKRVTLTVAPAIEPGSMQPESGFKLVWILNQVWDDRLLNHQKPQPLSTSPTCLVYRMQSVGHLLLREQTREKAIRP